MAQAGMGRAFGALGGRVILYGAVQRVGQRACARPSRARKRAAYDASGGGLGDEPPYLKAGLRG